MVDPNPIELQKALKGADYPVDRERLVELAKKNHADRAIIDKLESSGKDRFDGPNDVQKAIFRGR